MKIDPCDCRLSREAAMTCPRESRGSLVWTPADDIDGQQVGPMEVRPLSGEPYTLIFDGSNDWEWASEGLARDYARIRHLEFVTA